MKRTLLTCLLACLCAAHAAAAPAKAPAKEPAKRIQAVETRGVWVDKSDLYRGKEYLLSALDQLKAANLNTLYLPVWHKGLVTYPGSAYAPIDPDIAKLDPALMKWLIAEAHKRGFAVQAWTEYGFGVYQTTDIEADHSRGPILDKHPELTAIDADGKPYEHIKEWGYFYHLCPANPASHELLAAIFAEAVKALPFDALNLDRVRFPDEHFCFCDYCRRQFKADTGYELDASIVKDEKRMAAWVKWRKDRVSAFLPVLRKKLAAARPGLPVTAAVWYDSELDNKGQDWPEWLRKGWLEMAVPMIYWPNNDVTVAATAALSPDAAKLALGVSAADCDRQEVIRQVLLAREKGFAGVVFWYLGPLVNMTGYLQGTVFLEPARPSVPIRGKYSIYPAP